MIPRTLLLAAPGYVVDGSNNKIRVKGKITVALRWSADNISDSLKGAFSKVVTNRWVEATFTPLYYDATDTTATLFPYISLLAAATPPGFQIFTTSDVPWKFVGENGVTITFKAAAVTTMPSIFCGVQKDMLGQVTVTGVNATGTDPTSSSSFYAIQTAQSFTYPAIPSTAYLGRQKWTAVYGADTDWSSFSALAGFSISHELGLKWITDNGQNIGALITGYRPMCDFIPMGPTIAEIVGEMAFSGTGGVGGSVVPGQGQRYDANSADLVISGAITSTVTLKNATIESSEFAMASDDLNVSTVKMIGNVGNNSGANVAGLVLA